MAFPFAAVASGIGIAKSLFGGRKQNAGQAPSPYMGQGELNQYLALRDLLKRVRSPYMAYLMGRGRGGSDAGY